MKYWNIPISRI